ncbi:MAG: DNA polymerase ligase N-terminal domain-containing protein, partial [Terracidiphilus sp.]
MARGSATKTKAGGGSKNPLSRYWSKRNFAVTSEPAGRTKPSASKSKDAALPFVVQRHAATRLHYDFRLGWKGVLKSWAVTKGPSYFPGDKRLAVQVEDHPWEYRDFEGTIPKGQYGGGTVMVWDEGEWLPHGDVDKGLEDGHLKFELCGTKLKGNWTLIRMHGGWERNGRSDKPNWLLIKEKDEFAQESTTPAITEEAPGSAVSGRSIEEIAAANDRVWNSNKRNGDQGSKAAKGNGHLRTDAGQTAKQDRQNRTRKQIEFDLDRFPWERFPGFIAPQLAQLATAAPSGDQWLHELKFDGYRVQIQLRASEKNRPKMPTVKLITRKG